MKPYYQDSAVTIYHGDYMDSLDKMGNSIMFIDPPYNVSLGAKPHSERQCGYGLSGDDLSDAQYLELIVPLFRFCKDSAFVTPGNSNQALWPKPLWTMAWTKPNGVTRTPLTRGQKMNHACWEPVLTYLKLDEPPHSDVIECCISIQPECEGHPCPKPLRLLMKLLSMSNCQEIIDPFMGSGTTLRAAKDLGRKAIGIEIEEKYCEIAAKRMQQEVFAFSENSVMTPETETKLL